MGRSESHRAVVARGVVCLRSTYDNAKCRQIWQLGRKKSITCFSKYDKVDNTLSKSRAFARVSLVQCLLHASVFLLWCYRASPTSWREGFACAFSASKRYGDT